MTTAGLILLLIAVVAFLYLSGVLRQHLPFLPSIPSRWLSEAAGFVMMVVGCSVVALLGAALFAVGLSTG